jgi:ankyrin repeat protein
MENSEEPKELGGMFVPMNTDEQHMAKTVFLSPEPTIDVNKRDNDNCTPLHLAILRGEEQIIDMLLERGARISQRCEGALPLQIAVCAASLKENKDSIVSVIKMLVKHGCVVLDRDDHGRTPLHWAAHLGVEDAAKVLVEIGKEIAPNEHEIDNEALNDITPRLWEFEDKQGNLAAHLAARYGYPAILKLLVDLHIECVKEDNKSGFTVAHMAAIGGNMECAELLVTMCPNCVDFKDRQGRTPGDVAEKRGFKAIAEIFRKEKPSEAALSPRNSLNTGHKKTLIVAPPECLNHHTAPWPIARDDDPPPPENVKRLVVLTDSEIGCLKSDIFKSGLIWDERP